MKNVIERVVNGLVEENLGVLASWRDTQIEAEPTVPPNAVSPRRWICDLRFGA